MGIQSSKSQTPHWRIFGRIKYKNQCIPIPNTRPRIWYMLNPWEPLSVDLRLLVFAGFLRLCLIQLPVPCLSPSKCQPPLFAQCPGTSTSFPFSAVISSVFELLAYWQSPQFFTFSNIVSRFSCDFSSSSKTVCVGFILHTAAWRSASRVENAQRMWDEKDGPREWGYAGATLSGHSILLLLSKVESHLDMTDIILFS